MDPSGDQGSPPGRGRRQEPLSGALLGDVAAITVDPAYVEAAARRAARAASGDDQGPPRVGAAFLLSLTALGAIFAVAARSTRVGAHQAARVRATLAREVRERTDATDALVAEERRLRAAADAARNDRLRASRDGRELADRLAGLEAAVGGVPVSGPAVEVRLADSPHAGGPDDPNEDGRVRDRDIQEIVNALWAAGAEAVAVNGQRLSVLTAIREAGQAILVDYRPISPPYVVVAVGDPDVVEPAFAASPTAGRFGTFADVYGLVFEVRRRSRVELPAAETTRLRHAVPAAGAGTASPSAGGPSPTASRR